MGYEMQFVYWVDLVQDDNKSNYNRYIYAENKMNNNKYQYIIPSSTSTKY